MCLSILCGVVGIGLFDWFVMLWMICKVIFVVQGVVVVVLKFGVRIMFGLVKVLVGLLV